MLHRLVRGYYAVQSTLWCALQAGWAYIHRSNIIHPDNSQPDYIINYIPRAATHSPQHGFVILSACELSGHYWAGHHQHVLILSDLIMSTLILLIRDHIVIG